MPIRRTQYGLSLLELLLVLALLVIIGAIAAPAIGRFMQTQQLRDSANIIRGEFARARVQAMKSGRIHVFRFEIQGANYTVDFWMADDDALESGDAAAAGQDFGRRATADVDNDIPFDAKQLPDGVRFYLGEAETDARGAQVAVELEDGPSSASGIDWSPPILFYSDGTTSNADILLRNDREDTIRISLRGLTGISTVSEVVSLNPNMERDAP